MYPICLLLITCIKKDIIWNIWAPVSRKNHFRDVTHWTVSKRNGDELACMPLSAFIKVLFRLGYDARKQPTERHSQGI